MEMALQGVEVRGALRGLMFEASVEQRFANPSDKNVEVIYTFPLPWRDVLLGVDVVLGDKHLCGCVVEKKQAEACYEEALSEGNTAVMLERNFDQSYSLNLGNLAGNETCVVTLRYAQTLSFEQRSLRLMVPTVIAPRYGDPVAQGGLQPHQVPENSLLIDDYPFNIELQISDAMSRGRVASPSHPIRVAHEVRQGEDHLTVSLARRGCLDRDFVLVIDQLTGTGGMALGQDAAVPGRVVALASFCPAVPNPNPVAVCAKILVDCSGSMAGDSISAAKQALKEIVTGLEAGDRFSLSRFGSQVEHLGRGMWMTTDITRTSALQWVAALDAQMGGTEMEAALQSTFGLPSTQAADVLLITDGEISNIDETVDAARRSGHRLFIVGIGSSPAQWLLRRLAEATGGVCEFVVPGEAVRPAVMRMFARLRADPCVNDVDVRWPEGASPLWVSALPESIFDGDTVNVFALFDQAPAGDMQLLARHADGSSSEFGATRFNASIHPSDTLSRMAAADRIHTLQTTQSAEASEEVLRLALDYQLVTHWTNFLLVHERAQADRAISMPKLHKIVQMTPAGWAGAGSVLSSSSMPSMCDAFTLSPDDLLSTPSVWRTRTASARVDGFDLVDETIPIPAFLTKLVYAEEVDPKQDIASGRGWPPHEVSDWLQITPTHQWPQTIEEVVDLGLPRHVQRWLTELIQTYSSGSPTRLEMVVLRAFLHVMSQKETLTALIRQTDFATSFKPHLDQLKLQSSSHVPAGPTDHIEWVERVMQSLDGMNATAWPTNLKWPAIGALTRETPQREVRMGRVDASTGLSPIALSKWLLLTDPATWPNSYAKLELLGLRPAFVNQLADAVERRFSKSGSTEQLVVAAFVFVMAQTETCDALERSKNVFNALAGRLSELKQQGRSVATAGGPVDVVWLERITYALRDMVQDAWPDAASMSAQPSWRSKARNAVAERWKGLVKIEG